MRIEYTTEEGGDWESGDASSPRRLAHRVLNDKNGLPEHEDRLLVGIDGQTKPVHSLRFPVTGTDWNVVDGLPPRPWYVSVWPWRAIGVALAAILWALSYFL